MPPRDPKTAVSVLLSPVKGPIHQRRKPPLFVSSRGTLVWVKIVVTEIGLDGSIRRRALDTGCLTDTGRWDNLIGQTLATPPPYRAAADSPVYIIHANDRAVLVAEQGLTGPLRALVTTILATGDPAWRMRCRAGAGVAGYRPRIYGTVCPPASGPASVPAAASRQAIRRAGAGNGCPCAAAHADRYQPSGRHGRRLHCRRRRR
jgi:hypothetical protein